LGRLEDGEKQQQAALTPGTPDKPVVKKTLGLELSNMSDELRTKYKIKDTVKGIVILGIDAGSPASDKRLNAGDTIVEIAQEAVANADDFQAKIDKLKQDGRRTALLLVASAEGELRFVALALQEAIKGQPNWCCGALGAPQCLEVPASEGGAAASARSLQRWRKAAGRLQARAPGVRSSAAC